MAIIFPITAFVAAGFEHCVANMFLFPLAMLIQHTSEITGSGDLISLSGFIRNMLPVIMGNLVGGSVFVALVYHVIYRRIN